MKRAITFAKFENVYLNCSRGGKSDCPKPGRSGDYSVLVGQLRNQVPKHVTRGWKAVQQQQRWSAHRPGLAIGHAEAININPVVLNDAHIHTHFEKLAAVTFACGPTSQIDDDVAKRL